MIMPIIAVVKLPVKSRTRPTKKGPNAANTKPTDCVIAAKKLAS